MVQIARTQTPDGTRYELVDFEEYVHALEARGIEAPLANYHILIPDQIQASIHMTRGEWDDQVKMFFRVSPTTGIDAEIIEER